MASTDLSSFNNKWYKPGASILKRALWYICNPVFINSYLLPFSSIKCNLLRLFGANIGVNVVIKPKVNIKYPWKLCIGNYSWIGENVWIDNLDWVEIGEHCCVSQGAMLLTGNHNYKKKSFDLMIGKIILENGVWIGAKSIVCPGVLAKNHAVLTVGSVASETLEANTIFSGNPAKKVKGRIIE